MAKKALYLLLVSSFFMMMAGPAAAEAPVMSFPGDSSVQSPADPESGLSLSGSWQLREPVETGAVPSMSGTSPEYPCCTDNGGLKFDENGVAIIRPGIDDGP